MKFKFKKKQPSSPPSKKSYRLIWRVEKKKSSMKKITENKARNSVVILNQFANRISSSSIKEPRPASNGVIEKSKSDRLPGIPTLMRRMPIVAMASLGLIYFIGIIRNDWATYNLSFVQRI